MKAIVEITSGSNAPRFFEVFPGLEVVVGSAPGAQILLVDDRTVSSRHFALSFDGCSCRIRNLVRSQATLLNSRPITDALVNDGDLIIAGKTLVRIHLGEQPPGAMPALPAAITTREAALPAHESSVTGPTLHERVLEVLRSEREPLFAILDGARDPLVIARLIQCGEEYQSLYEGPKAPGLANVAPYLVALPPGSPFLETLVRDAWGNSWGIYLTSEWPFHDVRKRLRRLLTVETEDGKKLLFRFYDPRVLRVYLPTCTVDELDEFFGPIHEFLLEGVRPDELLRISTKNAASRSEAIRLVPLPGGPP